VDLAFTLKAIFKALVLPPTGPMLVALFGVLLLRRAPRIGRALVWTGALTLVLLCLPVVAGILARPFDMKPLDLADAKRAQAIVVLGGGTRRAAPEYGGDTLGRRTLERVRYGARVARETGLPVLVTGGVLPDVQSSEAALMREALEREYGVPVRWAEDRSRNTRENARLSAPLLRADGVTTRSTCRARRPSSQRRGSRSFRPRRGLPRERRSRSATSCRRHPRCRPRTTRFTRSSRTSCGSSRVADRTPARKGNAAAGRGVLSIDWSG